jgi:hypothetical protein
MRIRFVAGLVGWRERFSVRRRAGVQCVEVVHHLHPEVRRHSLRRWER